MRPDTDILTQIGKTFLIIAAIFVIGGIATFVLSDTSFLHKISATAVNALHLNDRFNDCIKTFSKDDPRTLHITRLALNTDDRPDAAVSFTRKDKCGSEGCITQLCVSQRDGSYKYVDFGYAAKTIQSRDVINNDMHNIMLNGKYSLIMSWNGMRYLLLTDVH